MFHTHTHINKVHNHFDVIIYIKYLLCEQRNRVLENVASVNLTIKTIKTYRNYFILKNVIWVCMPVCVYMCVSCEI